MKGHFYKKYCKCPKNRKCTCGAKWYFVIDIGIDPKTGKRKQKRKGGFATRKEAEIAAASLLREIADGSYVEETKMTFRAFAKQWLDTYQASGRVKISSIRVRTHHVALLLNYLSELELPKITLKMYQDALLDLKKKGYSDVTLAGVHTTGRMIFKRARELNLIKKDPTEFAIVPKEQKTVEEIENRKKIPKYLEREQLLLFLETTKTHGLLNDYAIFLTLAYTGMRIGELVALKWSDIDFENRTISITKTMYCPQNNVHDYKLLPPKTESSIRTIDVDELVIHELKKLRSIQNEIRMKHRKTYRDENFVFAKLDNPKLLGYPEHKARIRERMKRLLKIAGLDPSLSPHSLRHTHTSLLAEAGVTLEEIMERLGHKDDETTRNIYLHITKRRKKEVVRKFSELMQTP